MIRLQPMTAHSAGDQVACRGRISLAYTSAIERRTSTEQVMSN